MIATYTNPMNTKLLRLEAAICMFAVAFGLFVALIVESLIVVIVAVAGPFIYFLVFWWREHEKRPIKVDLTENSIRLHYRKGRVREVNLTDLSTMRLGSKGPSGVLGIPSESLIRIRGELMPIMLTEDIATAIKSAYFAKTRRFLPDIGRPPQNIQN